MTKNQRDMLDRLEYPWPSPWANFVESAVYAVVGISLLFLGFCAIQGVVESASESRCAEIARFYGTSADSPAGHAMLPPGVKIEYRAGRCLRTDNLTEMTGNELG